MPGASTAPSMSNVMPIPNVPSVSTMPSQTPPPLSDGEKPSATQSQGAVPTQWPTDSSGLPLFPTPTYTDSASMVQSAWPTNADGSPVPWPTSEDGTPYPWPTDSDGKPYPPWPREHNGFFFPPWPRKEDGSFWFPWPFFPPGTDLDFPFFPYPPENFDSKTWTWPITATTTESDGSFRTSIITWISTDITRTATVDGIVVPTSRPGWTCSPKYWCYNLCWKWDFLCTESDGPLIPERSGFPPVIMPSPPADTDTGTQTIPLVVTSTPLPSPSGSDGSDGQGQEGGGEDDQEDDDDSDDDDGGDDDDDGGGGGGGDDDDGKGKGGKGGKGGGSSGGSGGTIGGIDADIDGGIIGGTDGGTTNDNNNDQDNDKDHDRDDDDDDDDDDEEEATCTVTYTVAPHCSQFCTVEPITRSGTIQTEALTTSCFTAACETKRLCSKPPTKTATTYATATPTSTEPPHLCEPGRCGFPGGACLPGTADPDSTAEKHIIRARRTGDGDAILTEDVSSPEDWPDGAADWWKKAWRIVVDYGAGDGSDFYISDPDWRWVPGASASMFVAFDEPPRLFGGTPMPGIGGGSGPVWGCTMIVVASRRGVYTNHIWQSPNLFFNNERDREQYPMGHAALFRERVTDFLARGATGDDPQIDWYPGLWGLMGDGQPLDPEAAGFIGAWIITSADAQGNIYSPWEIDEIQRQMETAGGVPFDMIHVTTYRPNTHVGRDWEEFVDERDDYHNHEFGSEWFDGLLVWQYGPGSEDQSQRLVIRFGNEVLTSMAWCRNRQPSSTQGLAARQTEDVQNFEVTVPGFEPREDGTCVRSRCSPSHCSSCSDVKVEPAEDPSEDSATNKVARRQSSGTADVILANRPTDPETWKNGEAQLEWWMKTFQLTFENGPKIDYTAGTKEFSTTTIDHFGEMDSDGEPADEPKGGGVGPIRGCTSVVVASPRGIFTSHMWQIPSFAFEEHANEYDMPQSFYFEKYIRDVLLQGWDDENDGSDEQMGLCDSALARGQPFHFESLRWMRVYIITVMDDDAEPETEAAYPEIVAAIVEILKKDCMFPEDIIQQIFYDVGRSGTPKSALAPTNEFWDLSDDQKLQKWAAEGTPYWKPWMGMVSWQYGPGGGDSPSSATVTTSTSAAQPTGSGVPPAIPSQAKELVIRWEESIIFRQSWCGDGMA
ncbi:hypothetical protein HYQ44_005259 [Verticillium longisporum]|nr:hypothetical protein HYQ44_005259 [Verticillium longisporum]